MVAGCGRHRADRRRRRGPGRARGADRAPRAAAPALGRLADHRVRRARGGRGPVVLLHGPGHHVGRGRTADREHRAGAAGAVGLGERTSSAGLAGAGRHRGHHGRTGPGARPGRGPAGSGRTGLGDRCRPVQCRLLPDLGPGGRGGLLAHHDRRWDRCGRARHRCGGPARRAADPGDDPAGAAGRGHRGLVGAGGWPDRAVDHPRVRLRAARRPTPGRPARQLHRPGRSGGRGRLRLAAHRGVAGRGPVGRWRGDGGRSGGGAVRVTRRWVAVGPCATPGARPPPPTAPSRACAAALRRSAVRSSTGTTRSPPGRAGRPAATPRRACG